MKVLTGIVALLLCVSPAIAGDVPQDALASLGLGEMQTMTDAEGMQVRGQSSSFVSVHGASLLVGQLATSDFKNFVIGSSGNQVAGNGETTYAYGALTIQKAHAVNLDLNLNVNFPDGTQFNGWLSGSAGGAGQVIVIQ